MFLKCYRNTDCLFHKSSCVANPKRNRRKTFTWTPFHSVQWRTHALEDGGGSLMDSVDGFAVVWVFTDLVRKVALDTLHLWTLMKYLRRFTAPLKTRHFSFYLQILLEFNENTDEDLMKAWAYFSGISPKFTNDNPYWCVHAKALDLTGFLQSSRSSG